MTFAALAIRDFRGRWANLRREMKQVEAILGTQEQLRALDARLRIVLPEEYQACYQDVQPISMGSAGLQYDDAGRVAWGEIWDHFCDLAMAGGPPHKGKLLEPASQAEVEAQPERYKAVVAELCRGIRLVSSLAVEGSPKAGWIRVMCPTPVMAHWLVRAIVMENISAHLEGSTVEVPAGPDYRLEKEIKNVVTAIAKTFHYFDGHMEGAQLQRMAAIFTESALPLLQPWRPDDSVARTIAIEAAKATAAAKVFAATGLREGGPVYTGWMGLECGNVRTAIWMMRALVVGNLLARRQDSCLYVPIHPGLDPTGERLLAEVSQVHRLAIASGLSTHAEELSSGRS